MKMSDVRRVDPDKSRAEAVEMTPDDCSTDATRGSCKILRYKTEHNAVVTEQNWCTKHGREQGFYT